MDVRKTLEQMGYKDIKLLIGNNFDKAFVGLSNDNRAIYDYNILVECVLEDDRYKELSVSDAKYIIDRLETFCNTREKSPIILHRF